MFRPAIQRTGVLVIMAVISLAVFYGTSAIKVEHREPAYELKLKAAQRMAAAMQVLKDFRMAEAVFIDDVNDPNETALVGSQFTHITTDEGDLDAKISVLDPNVAAMVVDYLHRAGLKDGHVCNVHHMIAVFQHGVPFEYRALRKQDVRELSGLVVGKSDHHQERDLLEGFDSVDGRAVGVNGVAAKHHQHVEVVVDPVSLRVEHRLPGQIGAGMAVGVVLA